MTVLIPRPAATTLILRDGPVGPEVLMQRRSEELVFAPGLLAYPGGAVEPTDLDAAPHAPGRTDEHASTLLGVDDGGLAYWVAAIRECFEEIGILFASDRHGNPVDQAAMGDRIPELRRGLEADELTMAEVALELDVQLSVDALHYAGRFITPVGLPRRFDCRFFVAAIPQGQEPLEVSREATTVEWLRPKEVLTSVDAGETDLIDATEHHLRLVDGFDSTEALLGSASRMDGRNMAVPMRSAGSGLVMQLPDNPGSTEGPVHADTVGGG